MSPIHVCLGEIIVTAFFLREFQLLQVIMSFCLGLNTNCAQINPKNHSTHVAET